MKTQLVKVNAEYEQFLNRMNKNISVDIAMTAAKSILSTELVKILSPVVYGSSMSPMKLSKDIIDNINLEYFINNNDNDILESLLYNEFYKILVELNNSNSIVFNFNDKLNGLCNDIRGTIYYIISILANSNKNVEV